MSNVYQKFKQLERYGFDFQTVITKSELIKPDKYKTISDYLIFKSKNRLTIFHPKTGKLTFATGKITVGENEIYKLLSS